MLPPNLRLSQAHLQLLSLCPPQFQRLYLEPGGQLLRLTDPDFASNSKHLQWGKRFHLLMQQWQLGLPMETILHQQPELAQNFQALLTTVPELQKTPVTQCQAEHRRHLRVGSVILTVVYDFLHWDGEQAQILDWKTSPFPRQDPQKILASWQTKLYLYVLAQTSNYPPDRLKMTYWFVKLPQRPRPLTLHYSQSLHEQIGQELKALLDHWQSWQEAWHNHKTPLPHSAQCANCPYREIHQRQWEQ